MNFKQKRRQRHGRLQKQRRRARKRPLGLISRLATVMEAVANVQRHARNLRSEPNQ